MKIKSLYLYQFLLVFFLIRQIFAERVLWSLSTQRSFLRLSNVCLIGVIIIGLVLYLLEIYNSKDYTYYCICVPVVFILLLLSSLKIHNFDIMLSICLVLLAKDMNYYAIVKTYFGTMCCIVAFVVISSYFGITTDWMVSFGYGIGHSMGFNHPNNLGIVILSIILSWLYLHPNIKWYWILGISTFFGIVVWEVAAARTSSLILIALPWLWGLLRILKKYNLQKIMRFSIIILILAFIISFYLMFIIGRRGSLNNLESRFSMPFLIYDQYGIHLLGSDIPLVGSYESQLYKIARVILDNAYLRVILINGILVTLLIIGLYAVLIHRAYESHKYILLLIIILFIVEGFMEQFFLYVEFNFAVLATFANLNNLKRRKL